MISARLLPVVMFGVVLSVATVDAQDLSRYRDFALGSSLSSVTTTGGIRPADITVVHRRPAIIQDVVWRPPYGLASTRVPADPVRELALSFYNDQLFQIVVSYDRSKTEGMTNEDMIQALSATYGAPVPPTRTSAGRAPYGWGDLYDGATVAQWEDADHRITLRRGTYPVVFQLVIALTTLSDLAQLAVTRAVALDESEAPQREADQRKKEVADAIAAQEKARIANKAAFRP